MRATRFLAAIVALLIGASGAFGFGTVNINPRLGQSGEHENITRQALSFSFQPKTMDQLAGTIGSFGAVGAPDMPNRVVLGDHKEHCDGGDYLESLDKLVGYPQTKAEAQAALEECREYVELRMALAVDRSAPLAAPDEINSALDCNFREVLFDRNAGSVKCNVLKLFGEALHASEDFYSHTNWVDQPDPKRAVSAVNPPGLGNTGRAPWLDPRKKAPFPEGLISGCFELKELVSPEASCLFPDPRYKGDKQPLLYDRVKHANLNKDKGDISPIPSNKAAQKNEYTTVRGEIGDNFAKAVQAAVDDATDKWSFMKERIIQTYGAPKGMMIICVLEVDDFHECLKKKKTFTETPPIDDRPVIESVPPLKTPPCFAGESARLAWMNAVYDPWRAQVAAQLGKALIYSSQLEAAFHQAEHDIGPNSAAAKQAEARWKAYDPEVRHWRDELAKADGARAVIAKIPTDGCPQTTTTDGGDKTEADKGGDVSIGPLPPGFARPTLEVVKDVAEPRPFCDERARLAFIVDVLDPELARASHNAVIASEHTKALSIGIGEAQSAHDSGASERALRKEYDDWEVIRVATFAKRDQLLALRQTVLSAPLSRCEAKEQTPPPPPPPPSVGAQGKKGLCLDHHPILVGANGAVGSGARNRDKLVSTATGLIGGLLGVRGGGGGDDGPQVATCRISAKEMTVFADPETGVALAVGAKRVGDKVVVFAEVNRSPDAGTFQSGYLQDGEGARQAPSDVNICGLWGEWKLTVSWTRTTYANNQMVSRESGGWSKTGDVYIPGLVSNAKAPDGLWKRLGFSNASHGARKIALQYSLPKSAGQGDPVGVVLHITRPGRDPVDTVPFPMVMREGPGGFSFERATSNCE